MFNQSTTSFVGIMGILIVAVAFGGTAKAARPATGVEMTTQHDMIKQAITDAQINIQADIAEVKALVEALNGGAPPCGPGTEGQRFVVNGVEACDNTTGLYWQKTPDNIVRDLATANGHCQSLGDGIRLPVIKELLSLVDYGQFAPVLPANHPFTNVQSGFPSNYWTTTPVTDPDDVGTFWQVLFRNGRLARAGGGGTALVWCVH